MQIGWATSRCRFSPEEGYGVGDDCVNINYNFNKQIGELNLFIYFLEWICI